MLQRFLERAYRRLGPRYPGRALFLPLQLIYVPIVLGLAMFSLYVDMSLGELLRLALVGCGLQFLWSLLAVSIHRRLTRPIIEWMQGARTFDATVAAWRAAVSLPLELVRRYLIVLPLAPVTWALFLAWALYAAFELDLPAYSALVLLVGVAYFMAYAVSLNFFIFERAMRPVVDDIATALPEEAMPAAPGLSLRARLLIALPTINVITAAPVYGLARGGDAELADLAIVVLIAIAITGTVSLVLTLLLASSVSEPISELREATRRLGAGDFSARVPVVTTDETGELARAFNQAAAGLAEREKIRDAFGTYVDQEVAEHILREGTDLAGEEVEVTMMFIDVRDFTGFAERSEATEVVATINRLFERAVPIIHEHKGHVDKFVGDGLLAVFGAPRRQEDHADQALAAACEIAEAVEEELGSDLAIGIGLNSGSVVAGNVGGAGRLEFSVIGDAVNTAARVEAATRKTGDTVLIAERTKELLRESDLPLTERSGVELKGKREAVRLYAPEREGDGAMSQESSS